MPESGKNPRRSRRRLIFGGVLAVVLIAVVGLTTLRSNAAIDPSKLAAVDRGSIARSVVATGKIQPQVKVEVKSKASGIVKQILADYGDLVKEGQVLARLERLFIKETGWSPSEYYISLRLEAARDQLFYSENSIAHIAEACGFLSNAHFCRAFRKHYGAPPTAVRRRFESAERGKFHPAGPRLTTRLTSSPPT